MHSRILKEETRYPCKANFTRICFGYLWVIIAKNRIFFVLPNVFPLKLIMSICSLSYRFFALMEPIRTKCNFKEFLVTVAQALWLGAGLPHQFMEIIFWTMLSMNNGVWPLHTSAQSSLCLLTELAVTIFELYSVTSLVNHWNQFLNSLSCFSFFFQIWDILGPCWDITRCDLLAQHPLRICRKIWWPRHCFATQTASSYLLHWKW